MTIRFEMPYDFDSQLAALRAHDRRGWKWGTTFAWFIGTLISFLIIHAIFNGVPADRQEGLRVVTTTAIVAACVIMAAYAWQRFITPIMLRKSFDELGLASKSSTYVLDEERLVVEDDLHGGAMRWDEATEWLETDRVLLVYRGSDLSYNFDKSRIPAGAADFIRSRLREAGIAQA